MYNNLDNKNARPLVWIDKSYKYSLIFTVQMYNNLDNKNIWDFDLINSYLKYLICLITNAMLHTYFLPTLIDMMRFKWLTRKFQGLKLRILPPLFSCRFQGCICRNKFCLLDMDKCKEKRREEQQTQKHTLAQRHRYHAIFSRPGS